MSKSLAPSDTMLVFVENVNSVLDSRDISKSEFARRCGLSLRSIREILNNKGGSCTFATADKIAKALDLTVVDILTGDLV